MDYCVLVFPVSRLLRASTTRQEIRRERGALGPPCVGWTLSKDGLEASAVDAVRTRMSGRRRGHFLHRFADATIDLLEGAHPVLRRETFALMLREPRTEEWMGNALFTFLEEKIQDAQVRGEISDALSARSLTRSIMTALFGFFVLEGEAPGARKKQAHQVLDLLIGETA